MISGVVVKIIPTMIKKAKTKSPRICMKGVGVHTDDRIIILYTGFNIEMIHFKMITHKDRTHKIENN